MPTAAELHAAFRQFDLDGNGKISAEEFVSVLTRGGGGNPLTMQQAQQLIREFDRNNDGQLDVNEFVELMSSSKAVSMGGAFAKGVGTAFEFLDEHNVWQSITDHYIINQLGQLCGHNTIYEARYRAGPNSYCTTQGPDGTLSQVNTATGVRRLVRLVPFFFEFEEGPRHWLPVTAPEALMALTAVLASSKMMSYKATSAANGYVGSYESSLLNEQGLIQQRSEPDGIEALPSLRCPHLLTCAHARLAACRGSLLARLAACAARRCR